MEIFELRYFLGVAAEENFHRASEKLHISHGSLNKAVSRLEDELSIKLFAREGRNIRLTDHGRLFQKRASEIVQLEEAARLELAGHLGSIQIVMAGPEVLLSEMGLTVTEQLKKKFPKSSFDYHAASDEDAIAQVVRGEAHLAFVTTEVPTHLGLTTKTLAESYFQTVVGKGHSLYSAARAGKTISVEKALEHSFVSPNHPLLGKVGLKQSLDGWRDDQFPRRIQYLTSSLKLLGELVIQGRALAYLPDYYIKQMDVEVLKISGCPYSCSQKVRIVAKSPKDRSWLRDLF